MADLYNGYTGAGDPGGGRDATKFYAFDAKSQADAINANTHAQVLPPDTFANRPAAAAGNTGALYFCTDVDAMYRSTGSAWVRGRFGGQAGPVSEVPATGWTAANMQTGWTWSQDKDAMVFTAPTIGSGDNWGYQYRTYPTPPFTLTTYIEADCLTPRGLPSGFFIGGIVVSDGTKIIGLGPSSVPSTAGAPWSPPGWNIGAYQFSNVTSYNSVYNSGTGAARDLGGVPKWWQYVDDNTNRKLRYSFNGIEYHEIISEARTTFLTPTRIGIGADNYAGSTATLRVRSWNGVA